MNTQAILLKSHINHLDQEIEMLSKNDPEKTALNLSSQWLFISVSGETEEIREGRRHKIISELKEEFPDLWKLLIEKWIKLGEALKANTTIKSLYIINNHYLVADPKIFEAFWQGVGSNTSIQELRYVNNYLGRQQYAFEPIPTNQFFSALASNQTITRLDLRNNCLSKFRAPQWQEFSKVIGSHPSLKILNLSIMGLGSAEKRLPAFQSLTAMLQSNKTLTNLSLADNEFHLFEEFLPEKQWQEFCTALTQNKSLTRLDLSGNRLNETTVTFKESKTGTPLGDLALALGSHPTLRTLVLQANNFGGLSKKDWERLWNGLAQSQSLRKLKIQTNSLVNTRASHMGTEVFNRAVKAASERLRSILKAFEDHQTIFEIESEVDLFNHSESPPLKFRVDTNKKEKHGTALTLAHCLYNIQIKNNKMHQKGFPKGIVSNILSFLMPQTLNRQVITEVETHIKSINEGKKP